MQPETQWAIRTALSTPRAPITVAQRAALQRRLCNLPKVAARRGTTLDDCDRRREEREGRAHFEVGAWGWWASRRRASLTLEDRANVVFAVLTSGRTCVDYEFFTAFEFGERDFDAYFEQGDSEHLVDAIAAKVYASGNAVALEGLRANGWDRPCRQRALF